MAQPTPAASKLPRQLCCLLLPLVDHIHCSTIPRVLNGHCRDTAYADKAEPEFYVFGHILKAWRTDTLKAGFLALPPYIRDECLVDVQRRPVFAPVKCEAYSVERQGRSVALAYKGRRNSTSERRERCDLPLKA